MFSTTIEPRVSETDGLGHINNTTIPIWLEAGRNQLFKLFTPDSSFRNWKLIIIKMNIHFNRQIYFGREIEVRTYVNRIGNSSLELYEEIYQDNNLCVIGNIVYVNYCLEEQKAKRIPENIRKELEKHFYQSG